jgi:hypothetical protein
MFRSIGIDILVGLGDKLTAPLRNVEKTIADASDRMNKRLALSMKLAGGGAVATGIAYGAQRLVTGFTDSIRDVERAKGELATLGVRDLDAVVRRGREMQMELAGITADAFVRASYDIKSGISSLTDQGVAEMTAAAMVTAKATKGIPEQMTSLFATSYGIFKKQYAIMSDADFGNMFGAALSASVQQFKTDGAAMQMAIESAGAGAVNLGMKMTEQLTLLGMMQQTMQAGEAGTALKAFATNAAKAHEGFADLAKESGNPIRVRILDENGTLRAMPDILADLQARYGETLDAFEAAEIKEAFGTDEAMKLINALYGQEAAVRANAEALEDAADRGAEFTAEMARAADNNWDATMVLMSQKMNVLQQMIGERLLPVVQRLIPYIDEFIATTFAWIDANPELITTIGGIVVGLGAFAAVVAPMLLGASALVSVWASMSYGATRLTAGFLRLPGTLLSILNPLKWVRAGFVALRFAILSTGVGAIALGLAAAGVWIYKNWSGLSRMFAGFGSAFMKAMGPAAPIIKVVVKHIQDLIGWVKDLLGPLDASAERWQQWGEMAGEVVGNAINAILDAFRALPSFLAGIWQQASDEVVNIWQGVVGYFAGLWVRIKAGAMAGWELIKSLFFNYTPLGLVITHWDGLVGWFGSFWSRVKAQFVQGWASIKAEVATWPVKMKAYGADIIQKLIDGIKAKIGALKKAVSDALSALNPFSNVSVNVNMRAEARASALNPGKSGLSADRQSEVLAKQHARLKGLGVPGYARGGTFGPGPIRVGERGEELIYADQAGFVAHNGALRGMLDMASRAREIAQGIDFGGFGLGASPVPAMATVAVPGRGGGQRGPITLSPQYNMPLSFAAGVDIDEVRATVRAELMDAEERAMAAMRGLLHD